MVGVFWWGGFDCDVGEVARVPNEAATQRVMGRRRAAAAVKAATVRHAQATVLSGLSDCGRKRCGLSALPASEALPLPLGLAQHIKQHLNMASPTLH